MSEFDIILDRSKQNLTKVPDNVLAMSNLKMVYMEQNEIEYLPDDFFTQLKKLNWVDLRNNKLKAIPKSIAHHENLENLLLSNNHLEELPLELGMVPKLRVLHLSQNPLMYPPQSVISEGVFAICEYLRNAYKDRNCSETETGRTKSATTMSIEEKTDTKKRTALHPTPVSTPTHLPIQKCPIVKDNSIVHHIKKGPSEISLKSYYNKPKMVLNSNRMSDAELKEFWMAKIKAVLEEQQRILQQEKNLLALKKWREEKYYEPPRVVEPDELGKAPYDTQEEYMKMASREDLLNNELEKYVKRSSSGSKDKINIQHLVAELINELKDLENRCTSEGSPRHEIEEAANQIKTIMGIHRKIQELQGMNDKSV